MLFFLSFNIIIPEMPDYISGLGGEDYKGFIIGLFTLAAAFSRPISGKLSDKIGRLPVMIFGGAVCVIISFFYPLFTTVLPFLILRFFHGMSTGFMPTGTVAYLADIIPSNRRGEAMGLIGIMNNLGFMIGNAVSSLLTVQFGINNLFIISGILALLSVAVTFKMKETLKEPEPFNLSLIKLSKKDVWDSRALQPAVVTVLTVTMFGTLLTVIPDYSLGLGISNKGFFLSITTVSTIATRFFTAKLSDRIGRAKTTIIGTSFWVISGLLLASLNYHAFLVAGVTCGIASGINSPALFAWGVDVANGVKSGRAIATLFVALEIGIGAGAFGSAAIFSNSFQNLRWVFVVLTLINVVAILYTLSIRKRAY